MHYRASFYDSADGLRLFYRDYPGSMEKTPVLIIPGLWHNARAHDTIASHIAQSRRVLCADARGHGCSAYAPALGSYTLTREASDMVRLLAAAGVRRVIILGTSRGGIVAMALASQPFVAGVILNDIGGEVDVDRFRPYLKVIASTGFSTWEEAVDDLKRAHAAKFLGLSEERWRNWAHAMYREDSGRIVPDYDPKLADGARALVASAPPGAKDNLWAHFRNLRSLPALVVRAEHSDVLSPDVLARMQQIKPDLRAVTVNDRGHPPFLDEPEAIAAIDTFLETVA
jgi:pimeloyl-ACP methyl ester carboxylesterase